MVIFAPLTGSGRAFEPNPHRADTVGKGVAVSLSVAPVAQLDRAPGYEPGGREFESLRAHQLIKVIFESA
jgi:hypothetical protein